jgi:hypothetical protein
LNVEQITHVVVGVHDVEMFHPRPVKVPSVFIWSVVLGMVPGGLGLLFSTAAV